MNNKHTRVSNATPNLAIDDISSFSTLKEFGRYTNLQLIGEGGLSRVYSALDSKLGRTVALKILRKGIASSEKAKQRFMQEIKIQSNISVPGCVKTFDWGEEKGLVFCVMELIEGTSFNKFIHKNKISYEEKLNILTQVLEIISNLHCQGFEHRDIKPGNIIINKSNRVFILDFGLTKAIEAKHNIYTTTYGEFFGTPAYMSPENIDATDRKPRNFYSDIYSFGVMAYELFAGRLPYELNHLNNKEITYVIQNELPEPLKELCPEIHLSIAKIIDKTLNKNPMMRPSAKEILDEFRIATKNKISLYKTKLFIRRKIPIENICSNSKYTRIALISAACLIGASIILFGLFLLHNNSVKSVTTPVLKHSENILSRESFTVSGLNIDMIKIAPGSFTLRVSEKQKVFITNSFYISTHEITAGQYEKFPIKLTKNVDSNKLMNPVTNISWHDAIKFCRLLTAKEKEAGRLPEGYEYRLPTETEWEYAAGAGSTELYYHGPMHERLLLYAVYDIDKIDNIKTKRPNKFGLYDTLGNVWEWCYDAAGNKSILARINPVTLGKTYSDRAIRGGSASTDKNNTTLSSQRFISPHTKNSRIGFRIVLGKTF